jgi:hypothetical protein
MSDRTTTTIAAVALVACLAGAAAIAGAVQKQREELELVVKMEGIRGMPPHVAIVTAALGTFRGLAVVPSFGTQDAIAQLATGRLVPLAEVASGLLFLAVAYPLALLALGWVLLERRDLVSSAS